MGETVLTSEQGDAEVTLRVGDCLRVRLPENPTTGYVWTVEEAGPALALVDARFAPASDASVGAAGVRELVLRAERPGDGELRMKEWREWEGDASVTRRFRARVRVS